jgi:hypothetical protein
VFVEMLGQFGRPEEFEFDEATHEQLRREVERWRENAIELAQGRERRLDSDLDLGPEL